MLVYVVKWKWEIWTEEDLLFLESPATQVNLHFDYSGD